MLTELIRWLNRYVINVAAHTLTRIFLRNGSERHGFRSGKIGQPAAAAQLYLSVDSVWRRRHSDGGSRLDKSEENGTGTWAGLLSSRWNGIPLMAALGRKSRSTDRCRFGRGPGNAGQSVTMGSSSSESPETWTWITKQVNDELIDFQYDIFLTTNSSLVFV